MFPAPRIQRHKEHKYDFQKIDYLKMASIYGANGAGKSNLIEAIKVLETLVLEEEIPKRLEEHKYKYANASDKMLFAVEFIQNHRIFLYAVEISKNVVLTEELYLSSEDDKLLFKRETNAETKAIKLQSEYLEIDNETKVLKKVIEKNLAKPNKTLLKEIVSLDTALSNELKDVIDWFDSSLRIIKPTSKPAPLAYRIDTDSEFKNYAQSIMASFDIGIKDFYIDKKNIKEFFGEDNIHKLEDLLEPLKDSTSKMVSLRSEDGDEIVILKEKEEFIVSKLSLEHECQNGECARFGLDEESDGTVRLLDFIPAFHEVVNKNAVFIVDEIERSIHPLLIKELIRKFSEDINTKGQLIFSTHESNLLDQNIFRQDEIWFAEKDKSGSTHLYPLSDFKEHGTIDVRKGYLNGRYGSIPFLGNLKDLNWHQDANTK